MVAVAGVFVEHVPDLRDWNLHVNALGQLHNNTGLASARSFRLVLREDLINGAPDDLSICKGQSRTNKQ